MESQDVITEEHVRAVAEAENEANLLFRQAFRDHDGSDSGKETTFPEIAGDLEEEEVVEIPEGTEYPQVDFEYGENKVVYTKYGVAVPITDEAIEDGVVDVQADAGAEMLRAEARRMDSIAYEVLAGASVGSGVGDGGDNLSFDEVIDARAYHRSDDGGNYEPDLCFVEPLGGASLLKELKDRHTPSGDEAARTGEIGKAAGLSIVESNTGRLGSHDAILVDSSRFGWESSKYQRKTEEVREGLEDKTVFKVSDRLGWVATDGAAAIRVNG